MGGARSLVARHVRLGTADDNGGKASAAAEPLLVDAIRSAPVTTIPTPEGGTYRFHRFPFGERGAFVDAALLDEIVRGLAATARATFGEVDVVLSPEPGGHTWGTAVARELTCALAIAREGDTPDAVVRLSAYRHSSLVLPEVPAGSSVLVVDDVVSSGGTLAALLEQLAVVDCTLVGALVILAKGAHGIELVRATTGVAVVALAQLTEEGEVVLAPTPAH